MDQDHNYNRCSCISDICYVVLVLVLLFVEMVLVLVLLQVVRESFLPFSGLAAEQEQQEALAP